VELKNRKECDKMPFNTLGKTYILIIITLAVIVSSSILIYKFLLALKEKPNMIEVKPPKVKIPKDEEPKIPEVKLPEVETQKTETQKEEPNIQELEPPEVKVPEEEIPGFLTIKSTKQCPQKGGFVAQRLTRCQINEKYNLLVEWLGVNDRKLPTGYIVSLEDSSSKEKYHLFNEKPIFEGYYINLLNNNWIELRTGVGDMGLFYRTFRVIDLTKKEMVPIEVKVESTVVDAGNMRILTTHLVVVKNNREYIIESDIDASNFSYEKGGKIVIKDFKLNNKPLGVFENPLSFSFAPYSCFEFACSNPASLPDFDFNSIYKEDFSAIIFSLEKVGNFIFYIEEGRVIPYR
jgi:hypothetical protein